VIIFQSPSEQANTQFSMNVNTADRIAQLWVASAAIASHGPSPVRLDVLQRRARRADRGGPFRLRPIEALQRAPAPIMIAEEAARRPAGRGL
jgi:hypothetical protein